MEAELVVHGKTFEMYHSAKGLDFAVGLLAKQLNSKFSLAKPNENGVLVVGLLNGVFVFLADLVRKLNFQHSIQLVKVKSYNGMESSGMPEIQGNLAEETIKGNDILLVDDIADTGTTIRFMTQYLQNLGAKSVTTVVMFAKPKYFSNQDNPKLDYIGERIPNEFVIGYGLDFDEVGRGLPDLWKLKY